MYLFTNCTRMPEGCEILSFHPVDRLTNCVQTRLETSDGSSVEHYQGLNIRILLYNNLLSNK